MVRQRRPRRPSSFARGLLAGLVAVGLAGLTGALADDAPAMVPAPPAASGEVLRLRLDSIIQPVAAEIVLDALRDADDSGARAFVLELSTPGGLLTSTREIFTGMLGAKTPVIVFVAPSGAQAASAGFFLLMAGDVAAMAPGTNTGAAHPVGGNGETIEGTMGEKVEQDAAATIRSLAGRNGRDQTLAETAVRESRSFTADEALAAGLVDAVAPDLGRLLLAIDGKRLKKLPVEPGAPADAIGGALRTADATVRNVEVSGSQKIRGALAHPNIAYLLLTLGGLGLYFELSTPGAVLPGVIGGICLILAFYSLSVLPVNAAGIALIVLAVIFFIAEIKVTSYGLLTLGGIASLVMGSLMLFKSTDPALQVSRSLVAAIAVVALAVVGLLTTLALRAQRSPVVTGLQGLVGRLAVARTALAPTGKVFVHGELWDATASGPVAVGQTVEIVRAEGLHLWVRASHSPSAAGNA